MLRSYLKQHFKGFFCYHFFSIYTKGKPKAKTITAGQCAFKVQSSDHDLCLLKTQFTNDALFEILSENDSLHEIHHLNFLQETHLCKTLSACMKIYHSHSSDIAEPITVVWKVIN